MKNEAVSFADDMLCQREPRWISFLGTSGAGKTMLTKELWHVYRDNFHSKINLEKSKRSRIESNQYGEIVRDRGGFMNWGSAINNRMLKGEYEFLEDMRHYAFFAIDDIASEYERHRELSASKLYNVLESRLGKWTVITANLPLDAIGEKLDARIASRMIRDNSIVVDVDVVDYNLRARGSGTLR